MACQAGWCKDTIENDFGLECPPPFVPGVERTGYLWNYNDMDFSGLTFDTNNCTIVTGIKLLPGKRAYKFILPNKNPFNGQAVNLNVADNGNTFTNTLAMILWANDPEVIKDIINPLANGLFCSVTENKAKNLLSATSPGNSAFQVMGIWQGLTASALDHDKYSTDYNGGWYIEMTEENVPTGGNFLFVDDYATTKELLEGMLTPVSVGD